MLRIAYAIEDDRYPGLRDYYYELPQDIEKATRWQVTKLDRKVWAAMQALPGVVR